MEEKQTTPHLSRRDEKHLLRIATEAIKSDFPNPERLGCPGSEALKAIARRRLTIPDADDVVDHIATCAPCFAEYTDHRRRYRLRVVSTLALSCFAGLVAVAIIFRFGPAHVPFPKQPAALELSNPVTKATLDFRNRTVERSESVHPYKRDDIPHVVRAMLELAIKLPVGVEDGMYQVELRARSNTTVLSAAGIATWHEGAETLTTTVDCRKVAPGEYVLAIRKGTSPWRLYPVILD